jgi:hypothetical protein
VAQVGLLATVASCGSLRAHAQEVDSAEVEATVAAPESPATTPAAEPAAEPGAGEASSGASSPDAEEAPWLDRMRSGFGASVDGTARWFDGFFGETRYDDTTTRSFGRAKLVLAYKEYEGVIVRSELRGRFPLPNLDKRFNAIIGRGDADSIIEDDESFQTLVPDTEDDEWLAGLGYTPPWSSSGRISLSAGVHIDWPPDPYVQVRYKFTQRLSKHSLMRAKETVFWKSTEGFGSSTNIDFDRQVRDDRLVRWSNLIKVSEVIDGVRYDSRLTLYQKLGNGRAISWTTGIKGETGDPAPVREYGTVVIYRRRMFREWFYGEFLVGATWLREDDWDERKFGLAGGIGCEIFFGEPPASSTAPKTKPSP